MLFTLAVTLCLAFQPSVGVLPEVPSISNPHEQRGNRHARRRDAKREKQFQ
jgi:hypothetical protein